MVDTGETCHCHYAVLVLGKEVIPALLAAQRKELLAIKFNGLHVHVCAKIASGVCFLCCVFSIFE